MKRHVLIVLGAIGLTASTAGPAAAWDDSYRYCPGARGCLSAYYPFSFHSGPYYRPLPPVYRYAYGRAYYVGRKGGCARRGYRAWCS